MKIESDLKNDAAPELTPAPNTDETDTRNELSYCPVLLPEIAWAKLEAMANAAARALGHEPDMFPFLAAIIDTTWDMMRGTKQVKDYDLEIALAQVRKDKANSRATAGPNDADEIGALFTIAVEPENMVKLRKIVSGLTKAVGSEIEYNTLFNSMISVTFASGVSKGALTE